MVKTRLFPLEQTFTLNIHQKTSIMRRNISERPYSGFQKQWRLNLNPYFLMEEIMKTYDISTQIRRIKN